jgi:hypothetical protein
MIGGADIVIEYPGVMRASGGLDIAVRRIAARWPDFVIQDATAGNRFDSYSQIPFASLSEVFVYRDSLALESWKELGADPSNANSMVHLIADDCGLTIVVDDRTNPTMLSIIREIRDLLTGSQSWVRAA